MLVTSIEKSAQRKKADVVIIPFWEGKDKPLSACEDKEFAAALRAALHSGDFHGKEGETLLVHPLKGKEKRLLLLGLGKEKTCVSDQIRRSFAASVKLLHCKKINKAHFILPSGDCHVAAFEGVLLANYSFEKLKGETAKDKDAYLTDVCFSPVDKEGAQLLKRSGAVAVAVNATRDLVNGNADDVTSEHLSAIALDLEKQFASVKVHILNKALLKKEKMGFILAVNQGSSKEPALIVMEYRGDPSSKERSAIIGKGITYDTGGLNIKPTGGMETMKCDMSGAAATIGIIQAAASLKLKKNLIGVLAIAENAIGPNSYKPGDVIKGHSGKTVEIANTDAEGRLVLADALSYVQEKYSPMRMIDMATLTGGVVVALGEVATGLFSNDDLLAKGLFEAGERTHERLWRLPLFPEYKDQLKSSIADISNSGGKAASPCTAAVFLQQFVKDVPWAHLDIAGTAYISAAKSYHTTHATGVGVRLLIDFFENLK